MGKSKNNFKEFKIIQEKPYPQQLIKEKHITTHNNTKYNINYKSNIIKGGKQKQK